MDALQAVQVASGGVLASFGLILTIGGRGRLSRREGAAQGAWVRLGVGVAMFGMGYHLVGWGLPPAWFPLKVPVRFWWIVVAVASVVAIGGWRLEADRKRDQGGV